MVQCIGVNSRTVPGNEQVSERYGQRHAKFILLKSRSEIIHNFKEEFPECSFKESTLKREFPAYAVTPTLRDLQRNTCPIHANVRHLVKGINKILKKEKLKVLPVSCRDLSLKVICSSELHTIDPLTWNENCAMRRCEHCPDLTIADTDKISKKDVTFVQWEAKLQKVKNRKGEEVEKKVYALYSHTENCTSAIEKLKDMLKGLVTHVYIAHKQWNAHNNLCANLDLQSVITVEDYQMNIELEYCENPTSIVYSTNKVAIALYPIAVEFLSESGELRKGAIAFGVQTSSTIINR